MGASVSAGGGPRNRLRYIRFLAALEARLNLHCTGTTPVPPKSLFFSMLRTVLRYPFALFSAISMGWAVRRRDWYRKAPFLPLPSARYLRWRIETAYGDEQKGPSTLETRRFLRWAARLRRRMS